MIRKLTSKDNDQLMEYLKEEKLFNLFIIGDVENFGYDNDFQEVWAEFDENNDIKGVLLRYHHSYVPYSKGDFDVLAFANIIKKDKAVEEMCGKKVILEKFDGLIEFDKKKEHYFAEMVDDKEINKDIDLSDIKKAAVDDIDSIFELRKQIKEFNTTSYEKENSKQAILTKTGRTYFIERDGVIAASASTTAENSQSAMIVGVCTHPRYRKKGYATKCMIALCEDILREGLSLCLFYNNLSAGKIYRNIGFKDIGKWKTYSGRK